LAQAILAKAAATAPTALDGRVEAHMAGPTRLQAAVVPTWHQA
jgi:hypothetical protein